MTKREHAKIEAGTISHARFLYNNVAPEADVPQP
jgi:hypothetical protein